MKIFPLFKSMSRTVHEEHRQQPCIDSSSSSDNVDHDEETCTLTVWRRSLVMSCDGFTVIDNSGNLVYRVDNYLGRPEPLVLMDASGNSLLAMSRRKKLGLVLPEWMVYEEVDGEESCVTRKGTRRNEKKPICCVRKSIMSRNGGNKVLACVFLGGCCEGRHDYVIRGSYSSRSCKVWDRRGRVVAEIKRKEATAGAGVCFGDDVFLLVVYTHFQPVFAMALVLLLDQMF